MKNQILLVEDEEDARGSLARALRHAGYECLAVGTYAQACAVIAAHPALDAAVVDIVLGTDERAGLRLISQLRADGRRAPIVVITAFADLELVKQALNDGAAFLLEKPFAAAALLEVLGRLLADRENLAHFVDRALARCGLTDKERSIARLVLKGLPSAEIARLENNSDKTIRQHITAIYAKCGVSTRAELFHYVFPS